MGTKADLAERDMRFGRLRDAMARENLDALLVAGKGHWWTGRGYFRYLTDFHLWGHDGLVLFPAVGEPVGTLTSHAVAGRVVRQGWVTEMRGDVFLVRKMAELIEERRLVKARIGVVGFQWILGAGNLEYLREAFPHAQFVNADDLLNRIRMVKSPLEIEQIRELWTLSKACMERFVEVLEPGRTQRELAAEASKIALAGGVRDMLVFINEDADSGANPPQDVPMQCTDVVTYHMELCGESGHWSEITVNCAYREPSLLELKLMDSEMRANAAVQSVAKPGARLSAMAETFEQSLQGDGWQLNAPTDHFDFHGQGMDTIEFPWYSAAPGWGAAYDTVLLAGMVFSYHPRRNVLPRVARTPGINEDVLITERGIQRLSEPWDLRWRLMG